MRRPPLAFIAGLIGLATVLAGCQLPSMSGGQKSKQSAEEQTVLVPFAESNLDGTDEQSPADAIVSIPDTAPDTTAVEEIEADAEVPEETDPPEPTTTSRSQNPTCKAAKRVVALNKRFDDSLTKVLNNSNRISTLVSTLRRLPVTDLRNAYDDLSAELNTTRRRRLAVVRDFTVDVGELLSKVRNIETLTEAIVKLEDEKKAPRAREMNRLMSVYVNRICGFKFTMIGDGQKKS
jgi:hypothetical protein